MKVSDEKIKSLLIDTLSLLCKNGLHYKKGLKIQGTLGVTIDEDEIVFLHIDKDISLDAQEQTNKDTSNLKASASKRKRSLKSVEFPKKGHVSQSSDLFEMSCSSSDPLDSVEVKFEKLDDSTNSEICRTPTFKTDYFHDANSTNTAELYNAGSQWMAGLTPQSNSGCTMLNQPPERVYQADTDPSSLLPSVVQVSNISWILNCKVNFCE